MTGRSSLSRSMFSSAVVLALVTLAHGLLDQADDMRRAGDERADEIVAEARALGERLGCVPVIVRADTVASDSVSATTFPP